VGISIGGDRLRAQARHGNDQWPCGWANRALVDSVNVPVVNVRVVRMAMGHCSVFVPVAVTAWAAPARFMLMLMLMVFIMAVFVLMLHLLVDMFMPMVFSQVQPHAHSHQGGGDPKP